MFTGWPAFTTGARPKCWPSLPPGGLISTAPRRSGEHGNLLSSPGPTLRFRPGAYPSGRGSGSPSVRGNRKQVQEAVLPALEENSVVVKRGHPSGAPVRTENVFRHPRPAKSGKKWQAISKPNPPEEKAAFPLDHLVLQRPAVIEPIRAPAKEPRRRGHQRCIEKPSPKNRAPPERSSELQVEEVLN